MRHLRHTQLGNIFAEVLAGIVLCILLFTLFAHFIGNNASSILSGALILGFILAGGVLLHRSLKTPPPRPQIDRDIEEADRLIGQIMNARQAHGLTCDALASDGFTAAMADIHSEGHRTTDAFKQRLATTTSDLARISGLFDTPSHTLIPGQSTLAEAKEELERLRDLLRASLSLSHPEDKTQRLFSALCTAYARLFHAYLDTHDSEKHIPLDIPYLDLADDPHGDSDYLLTCLYDETVLEQGLFTQLHKTIGTNIHTAGDVLKITDRPALPRDARGILTGKETLDLFFAGTPLTQVFDVDLPFSLTTEERFTHHYVLGKTGSGKSVFLRSLIAQDIHAGRGVIVITPERGLIRDIVSYIPPEREKDLIFFDPGSSTSPIVGFNPFATTLTNPDDFARRKGELETTLLRGLGDLGVKMKPILSHTVKALLRTGGSFSDIPHLLSPTHNTYRQAILTQLNTEEDAETITFFREYDTSRYYKEGYEPIINRLDPLLALPLKKTLAHSSFDFSTTLNHHSSIVLCNLSGLAGFQAEVVGQMLLATLQATFFQREYIQEDKRLPYFVYLDEFQTFATSNEESLRVFLTRARKYKTGIVMAHQNMKDIPPTLLSSIFGNCGTLSGMLMSAEDAGRFTREAQLSGQENTKATTLLQNFTAGEMAMTTPKKKKAFLYKAPEYPPGLTQRHDIDEIIHRAKERIALDENVQEEKVSEIETTGEDEFEYHVG